MQGSFLGLVNFKLRLKENHLLLTFPKTFKNDPWPYQKSDSILQHILVGTYTFHWHMYLHSGRLGYMVVLQRSKNDTTLNFCLDIHSLGWKSSQQMIHSQTYLYSTPWGGGVLTLTWYTYMCLPFGAPFREIWYSDRGVFIRDEGAQIT